MIISLKKTRFDIRVGTEHDRYGIIIDNKTKKHCNIQKIRGKWKLNIYYGWSGIPEVSWWIPPSDILRHYPYKIHFNKQILSQGNTLKEIEKLELEETTECSTISQ